MLAVEPALREMILGYTGTGVAQGHLCFFPLL